MPPIPTTLKIQHGFAVFTHSIYWTRALGTDVFKNVTSYINLKAIIGFRVGEDGLLIDVKGHNETSTDTYTHQCTGPTSYINVGRVTTKILDTLCEALAPLMGVTADTTDLLDMA